MRNTKGILKADPKLLPTEMQENITHTPIDDNVKTSAKEEHKTDEADIRTFLSDTYDVSGNEYDDDEQNYLK